MLPRRGDEPELTGPAHPPADSRWADVALTLIWVVLLLVPFGLLGYAYIESFYLPGGTPPPKTQLDRAKAEVIAGVIVLFVTPLAGWLVAAETGHRVQAWLFGIIFFVALFVACTLMLYTTHSHP